MATTHPLRKILGVGFGIAFAFGTMVGVGILRLPGEVIGGALVVAIVYIALNVALLRVLSIQ